MQVRGDGVRDKYHMVKISLVSGLLLLSLATLSAESVAWGSDAAAGKVLFRQQCSLCHSAEPNDGGGAQGPNLNEVFGRRAGGGTNFSYTKPMRESGLTWNAATLERFLNSPTTVVPGSAMVVAVPDKSERDNLIAYFNAVKEKSLQEPLSRSRPVLPTHTGAADWKTDAPGYRHRIDVTKLPPPFATPPAENPPQLVKRPVTAKLLVPSGFHVRIFARGLTAPRGLRVAANGDIFVAETSRGRLKVMRPSSDGSRAETITTFAQGLTGPFGLQFYPSGSSAQWLYVAEENRVVRYAYTVGDRRASGAPEVVVAQLAPTSSGHTTRDLAFSTDGQRMFVSVGSMSNVAEEMPKKTPEEIKAWERAHGVGATWGDETDRADVLAFDVGSSRARRVFASGLRNCVGLTVQPGTGNLWCTVNERDMLGDDLVPDYSTRVKEGGFYGWPWYYMGNYEDPRLRGQRPDLLGRAAIPDVAYQAHSAPLNLVFYTATSGSSAFPTEYVGDGFAVMHGSWNRASRTGHKVVRVRMNNGVPTGEYDDFLVGFIVDNQRAWGRPVGAAVARDGSLLISDDGANLIYRVSYTH
jgi:glucose/arabinose dehydrogenase/cytochrome c2